MSLPSSVHLAGMGLGLAVESVAGSRGNFDFEFIKHLLYEAVNKRGILCLEVGPAQPCTASLEMKLRMWLPVKVTTTFVAGIGVLRVRRRAVQFGVFDGLTRSQWHQERAALSCRSRSRIASSNLKFLRADHLCDVTKSSVNTPRFHHKHTANPKMAPTPLQKAITFRQQTSSPRPPEPFHPETLNIQGKPLRLRILSQRFQTPTRSPSAARLLRGVEGERKRKPQSGLATQGIRQAWTPLSIRIPQRIIAKAGRAKLSSAWVIITHSHSPSAHSQSSVAASRCGCEGFDAKPRLVFGSIGVCCVALPCLVGDSTGMLVGSLVVVGRHETPRLVKRYGSDACSTFVAVYFCGLVPAASSYRVGCSS